MAKPGAKPWNSKVGSLLLVVTIIISMLYWDGSLSKMMHGQVDYYLVLMVCAATGCLSGIFYTLKENWRLAIIPGAISGAGSFAVFDWYTSFFHRTMIIRVEAFFVCLAGALPGFILYLILRKTFDAKKAA